MGESGDTHRINNQNLGTLPNLEAVFQKKGDIFKLWAQVFQSFEREINVLVLVVEVKRCKPSSVCVLVDQGLKNQNELSSCPPLPHFP